MNPPFFSERFPCLESLIKSYDEDCPFGPDQVKLPLPNGSASIEAHCI